MSDLSEECHQRGQDLQDVKVRERTFARGGFERYTHFTTCCLALSALQPVICESCLGSFVTFYSTIIDDIDPATIQSSERLDILQHSGLLQLVCFIDAQNLMQKFPRISHTWPAAQRLRPAESQSGRQVQWY